MMYKVMKSVVNRVELIRFSIEILIFRVMVNPYITDIVIAKKDSVKPYGCRAHYKL